MLYKEKGGGELSGRKNGKEYGGYGGSHSKDQM